MITADLEDKEFRPSSDKIKIGSGASNELSKRAVEKQEER